MAWHDPAQLGVDVWVTQIVMLVSDLIVHAALSDFGVRADLVAGHSYGEFAALAASGAWDLEAVVTATRARYEAIMAIPGSRGTLMASTAPADLIERLASTLAERIFAANYNAPDQTVVGGSVTAVTELSPLLEAQNYKCQMLPVPCPFHTPLMAGCGPYSSRRSTRCEYPRARAVHLDSHESVSRRAGRYSREPGLAVDDSGAVG